MERIFSNAVWEKKFSYARAVKFGNQVAVTGTVSINNFGAVHGETAAEQTNQILKLIEGQLEKFGLDRTHIYRTRMYITTSEDAMQVGEAHGAFFRNCEPCTSMVVVKALIGSEFLVEIEADAYCGK